MILLDLDGVLADFNSAACQVHGSPGFVPRCWHYYENWGLTEDEFWKPIRQLGPHFYGYHVRPYLWAEDVWGAVKAADNDVMIVTCAGAHPEAYGGKRAWVDKHIGKDVPVVILSRKYLMAAEDRLLIDDSDDNVKQFALHGGKTCLFSQPWNQNRWVVNDRLSHLYSALDVWRSRQPYHQSAFAD